MQACWTNLSSREIIVACRFNVYTLILWVFFCFVFCFFSHQDKIYGGNPSAEH